MAEPTMSSEREKKLRELAGMMNTRHRLPFPVSKPLLDCFDIAMTPEENEFLLLIGTEPLKRSEAPIRTKLPEEEAGRLFDISLRKGFLWPRGTYEGEEVFALSGIMLGWFEIYLADGGETPEQQEFARRLDLLIESWGKMNSFPIRSLVNWKLKKLKPAQSIVAAKMSSDPSTTTIPVGRSVDAAPMKIYPATTVLRLIEQNGDADNIAVVHCFCRQYHKLLGETCRFDQPGESCIAIGALARHAVKYGTGRHISKEEATALVRALGKRGAVHQVFHELEDVDRPEIGVCNCCWDCCGVFGSYNRGILPLKLRSYFEAQVSDSSLCNGCETCVEHCPVQAISTADGKPSINERKCIGCGQCELQCPQECIHLVPNERNVLLPLVKRSEARIPRLASQRL
jgi:ferredoxin